MSITINIKPELEEKLNEIAVQEGKQVDNVIVELLEGQLLPEPVIDPKKRELELLQKISTGISTETWEKYYQLVEKRDAETLTEAEYNKLLEMVNHIELANAERIKHLVELAKIRQTSLEDLMEELGISPQRHGES